MEEFTDSDGCPAWRAEAAFDDAQLGWTFHWGVVADSPQRTNVWALPTEVRDPNSKAQYRDFVLRHNGQTERYWLTHCRRLGANKFWRPNSQDPVIRFSVWAPHAKAVDVVFGEPKSGYIWSDGRGVQRSIALSQGEEDIGEKDIWYSDPADPALATFHDWDHKLYMFRIKRDDGSIAYRSDLYSRCQIGAGRKKPEDPDPKLAAWDGTREDLDGTKSCSVIIDPERVTALLNEGVFPETKWLSDTEFWASEHDPLRPVPDRLEELVIYELHVEGLGAGQPKPGSFKDAIDLLDHLVELGVNAVELMPMSEAEGWTWGYGTSNYFATEYAGGGRDQFKHFVRACHQRGIAVLLDVVYNHFVADSERAEWMYDTTAHHKNSYYWYEGVEGNWPSPDGGYLDNGSTGWTPNLREEFVRKMFTSSAAMLLVEFHVDGFRVDLTQALHRDNVIHANGASCGEANLMGAKFLREWTRTLRLFKNSVILLAEDHSGWPAIVQPQEIGGIGFDAIWWVDWYHNLIGDSQSNLANARLIHVAGFGGNEPLAVSALAEKISATPQRVIYHESHDQAGNASYEESGQTRFSARTIQVAVNEHLDGNRPWAEARCRVACGLTLLTPGTPMFFMGEEVGAKEPYRYDDWLLHREDFSALRNGSGAQLFRFYRDVIRLRLQDEALISPHVEVLHAHDANRVLAFRRWLGEMEFLIVASLNNTPFDHGYWIAAPALRGSWIEMLNSDAQIYGGRGLGNGGVITASDGGVNVNVPANSIVVFERL